MKEDLARHASVSIPDSIDETPPKKRRYLLGRPVYTAEDRRARLCPLTPESEWIEEAKRIRAKKD